MAKLGRLAALSADGVVVPQPFLDVQSFVEGYSDWPACIRRLTADIAVLNDLRCLVEAGIAHVAKVHPLCPHCMLQRVANQPRMSTGLVPIRWTPR